MRTHILTARNTELTECVADRECRCLSCLRAGECGLQGLLPDCHDPGRRRVHRGSPLHQDRVLGPVLLHHRRVPDRADQAAAEPGDAALVRERDRVCVCGCERESVCVRERERECVCERESVCVRERERERVCEREREYVRERVCV